MWDAISWEWCNHPPSIFIFKENAILHSTQYHIGELTAVLCGPTVTISAYITVNICDIPLRDHSYCHSILSHIILTAVLSHYDIIRPSCNVVKLPSRTRCRKIAIKRSVPIYKCYPTGSILLLRVSNIQRWVVHHPTNVSSRRQLLSTSIVAWVNKRNMAA